MFYMYVFMNIHDSHVTWRKKTRYGPDLKNENVEISYDGLGNLSSV